MDQVPILEIKSRIKKVQKKLQEQNIDIIIVLQKTDLFYLCGTSQKAYLIIPKSGSSVLLVEKSYERAKKESPLKKVKELSNQKELYSSVKENFPKIETIGMELDVLPTNLYFFYKSIFPESKIIDISPIIKKNRMIKSKFELDKINQAGKLNDVLFNKVINHLEIGKSEIEISGRLEQIYRTLGHQGIVRMRSFNQELFYGLFLSGRESTIPSSFDGPAGGTGINYSFPQGASFKLLSKNEPIFIDYIGNFEGYSVDQTRIFAFGSLKKKITEAHKISLEIENNLKLKIRPNIKCSTLYENAHAIAKKYKLDDFFMGYKKNKVKFIGHGIGLEVDELPIFTKKSNMCLKEGMTFALEPKFVFPGEGIVGIENSFIVTQNGVNTITKYPRKITYC